MTSILKKAVPVLNRHQLKELHTGSLLTRLQKLRELEDNADEGDWLPEELSNANGMIIFKETAEWQDAYTDIKAVLKTREHIPRGNKEKRQQQAHSKKHR